MRDTDARPAACKGARAFVVCRKSSDQSQAYGPTVSAAAARVDGVGIERVAGAAHRTDQVDVFRVVERLAQPPDMDVDGPRLDIDVVTPDDVQQLVPAEHTAGMLHEMPQKPELGGS